MALQGNTLLIKDADNVQFTVIKSWGNGEGLPADIPDDHRGQRLRIPGLRWNGKVPPAQDTPHQNILLPPLQRQRKREQREHEPDRPPLLSKENQLRQRDSGGSGGGRSLDEQLPRGHPGMAFSRSAVRGTAGRLTTEDVPTGAGANMGTGGFYAPSSRPGRGKTTPEGRRSPGVLQAIKKFLQDFLSFS